ncbi:hypothetical protein FZEAL_273 [Fusarium zealandicum]|uniref:Alpha-L-rhamnosidase six-hairpin glycosidase domain-containing protein n=1 Tax=Fusarium zealandicum TaxID=1053134 RepID=A0A8H4UV08_9HYPO|nr:hypothetical protein FZEAL_273 [Fusarium zealandicum]
MLLQWAAALGFSATVVASSCWRDTACTGPTRAAFRGRWEANIFAPLSRSVAPKSVLSLPDGDFISNYGNTRSLTEKDPALVYDFGVEVGGVIHVNYTLDGPPTTLGLAFTESKIWIGTKSDNSNGGTKADGNLLHSIKSEGPGSYTVPVDKLRGGFRYLTLFQNTTSTLRITGVSLEISFQPTWENLRAYQGYFDSSDDMLNKIWYAGAYTIQTNMIHPDTGRHKTNLPGGWLNDAKVGPGDSLLVDGAKRDRWAWFGDMGIAVPTAFVSTGDMESIKNALEAAFANQFSDGELPYAGPPYATRGSNTYHMWSMIGAYNYVLYTNDLDWLNKRWAGYQAAMDFLTSKVGSSGLLHADGQNDWARYVRQINGSAPNMLLYRTLETGAFLANLVPSDKGNLTADYTKAASTLAEAIQKHLWDNKKQAFKDTPVSTSLWPQDANSMAVAFGVVKPESTQAKAISTYLTTNWTPIGPESPELPRNVSPFISSIEVDAHFRAGRADRAIELIKTCWGWYLNNPNGTESTTVEGYLIDGSFGYRDTRGYRNDPSYTSHAHGWGSGPTSSLTQNLVGLQVTKPSGIEWQLKPVFEGVDMAEAGFTTSLGTFQAKWSIQGGEATVEWRVPSSTRGLLDIPGREPQWIKGGKGTVKVKL